MLPLTELGHSRQGQTKMGEVKWVINPHVGVKDEVVCLSDVECSYPPRGTHTDLEEWHCTLQRTKPELTVNRQGCALLKRGVTCEP